MRKIKILSKIQNFLVIQDSQKVADKCFNLIYSNSYIMIGLKFSMKFKKAPI